MQKPFAIISVIMLMLVLSSCTGKVSIVGKWADNNGTNVEFLKDGAGIWDGANFTYELKDHGNTIQATNLFYTKDFEILKLSKTELVIKHGSEMYSLIKVGSESNDRITDSGKLTSSYLSGAWELQNYTRVTFSENETGVWDGIDFTYKILDKGKSLRINTVSYTKDFEVLKIDSSEFVVKSEDESYIMTRMEESANHMSVNPTANQPAISLPTETLAPTTVPAPETMEMSIGEVKQFGKKLFYIRRFSRINNKCEFSDSPNASSDFSPILEVFVMSLPEGDSVSIKGFHYRDAFGSVESLMMYDGKIMKTFFSNTSCLPPVGVIDQVSLGYDYLGQIERDFGQINHFYLAPTHEIEWNTLRGFGLEFTVDYDDESQTTVFVDLNIESVSFGIPEQMSVLPIIRKLYNDNSKNVNVELLSLSTKTEESIYSDIFVYKMLVAVENISEVPYTLPYQLYIVDQFGVVYLGSLEDEVKLFPGEKKEVLGLFKISEERELNGLILFFDKPINGEAYLLELNSEQINSAISNMQPIDSATNTDVNDTTAIITPTFDPIIGPGIPEYENIDTCASMYETQLSIGMTGMVALGGLPNRIRSDPNMLAGIVGQISPGELFNIALGPLCVNGNRWWKIEPHSNNIPSGWTVEGDETTKWLVPCNESGICQ